MKVLIAIVFAFFLAGCDQPTIYGQWKTKSLTTATLENTLQTINLSDQGKLVDELFITATKKYKGGDWDSLALREEILHVVRDYLKTGINFKAEDRFELINYNLIIATAHPGLHLPDTIVGTWEVTGDTLTLKVPNDVISLTWMFKVLSLTSDSLRIHDITSPVSKTGNEILFVRP